MQLVTDKLNKSFGKNHVLKDVSFTAESGIATGLLGRNGSGKTTTIRLIMDIYQADSGKVSIDGRPSREYINSIGYLPEERGLYPKRKISDQIAYLGQLRGMSAKDARRRGAELLEKLDAGEYFERKLDTLSKGNQQKIQLAISILNDPDIIILDEPFSGLDPVNSHVLKALVKELVYSGKLVLFSSHQMSQVEEFCDNICLVNKGEIILSGSLREIKKSYPRNKILIVPEDGRLDQFSKLLDQNYNFRDIATSKEKKESGLLITLKKEDRKTDLFNSVVASGINLDKFMVVEPTLEEIFVEKVGGNSEAV